MDLTDKVIAITGASGQLGQALRQVVTQQGGRVALLDLKVDPSTQDPSWAVDLSSFADTVRALDAAARHYGRIDGLVNVAGGFTWQGFLASTDLAEWTDMFTMNVMTAVHASKAALPHMQRGGSGRIVNICTTSIAKGTSGMGAYSASKSALARFTEALADELKTQAITVNAVLPSVIDTPRNRQDMPDADSSAWVTTTEVAQVIGFLLSDAAAGVTGALIPVPGRV